MPGSWLPAVSDSQGAGVPWLFHGAIADESNLRGTFVFLVLLEVQFHVKSWILLKGGNTVWAFLLYSQEAASIDRYSSCRTHKETAEYTYLLSTLWKKQNFVGKHENFFQSCPCFGPVGAAGKGGMPMQQNLWESRKLHEAYGIWIGYKSASPLHVYGSLHICDYPYE